MDVERRGGDALPRVQAPRAAHAGRPERGAALGVVEQAAHDAAEAVGVARRNVHAGDAVDDGVDHPADGRGDDGHATGHRLERHDPERLVPGRADDEVAGAHQPRQVGPLDASAQRHPPGDAVALGDGAQALGLRVGVELGDGRAARDHELGVGHAGERLDDVADALALHEAPDAQQPPHPRRPPLIRAVGREALEVDAARHDGQAAARRAEPDELEDLVAGGGDDRVGAAHDVALDRVALGGRGVLVALVAALDDAERVEGLHDGHAVVARGHQRRVARHPEVGVHDVGPVAAPGLHELGRERLHVDEQVVLGDRPRRPGVDVVDDDARRHLDALGQRRVVAARVDDNLGPAPGERLGERGDVDVLSARVDPAERRERAGVLGHHRDSHVLTSSSRSSQSDRKRSRP